jgi:hypothetical protein
VVDLGVLTGGQGLPPDGLEWVGVGFGNETRPQSTFPKMVNKEMEVAFPYTRVTLRGGTSEIRRSCLGLKKKKIEDEKETQSTRAQCIGDTWYSPLGSMARHHP